MQQETKVALFDISKLLNASGKTYHPLTFEDTFCPNFSHFEFIKTTKQLTNNALLACKRCPLSPLVTPF